MMKTMHYACQSLGVTKVPSHFYERLNLGTEKSMQNHTQPTILSKDLNQQVIKINRRNKRNLQNNY